MEFQVLGSIRVRRDGQDVAVPGVLARTLLGVLLSRPGASASVGVLIEAMWPGESRTTAARKLQLHVSKLRALIGDAGRLTFENGDYRLRVEPGEFDVTRFERLIDEAAALGAADPERCVDLAGQALALWRGDPYGGLDVPALADESRRLGERQISALQHYYEAQLNCGRHAEIIGELTRLTPSYPWCERLHGLLMTALHRSGRQVDALEVYRSVRRHLAAELGIDPGPGLRELERTILAGEDVPFEATAPPPASVPAQLPQRAGAFVGREDELAELDSLSADDGAGAAICVITGTAGVGKTELALRWAHQVRDDHPDGQLYVDLRGYSPEQPMAPGDALGLFLRALGLPATEIPHDIDEQSAKFRSIVDGRRLLIVLDNAGSAEQVRPLLPGTGSSRVLITSRDTLGGLAVRHGARRLDLDRLAVEHARVLLETLLGDRATMEPDACSALIERCAQLPLALRVAAELIRARRSMTVGALVNELADRQDRLDLLDLDGDPVTAVRAVLSWSYLHLPSDAADLFRLCGLHPGHDMDAYGLAALAGTALRDIRRPLDTLVRANLIDEGADGRLTMHDLLSAYATDLATTTDPEPDRSEATGRVLDHYLRTTSAAMDAIVPHERERRPVVDVPVLATPSFTDHGDALRWVDIELPNLVAAALGDTTARPRFPNDLSVILFRYLDDSGSVHAAVQLHSRALDVARLRRDRGAEAQALQMTGLVFFDLGRYDEAEQRSSQALRIFRELGDRRSEAAALNSLAGNLNVSGRAREAVDHLEQALTIYRELGAVEEQISPLNNIGYVCIRLGEHAAARRALDESLALAVRIGSRSGEAYAWINVAGLHLAEGDHAEAERSLHRVLALSRDGVGSLEGVALRQLGDVRVHMGDRGTAMDHYRSALAIAHATADTSSMSGTLNGLGTCFRLDGNPDAAVRHHREALDLATEAGLRYEEGLAQAGLGYAHDDLGQAGVARNHWRQAAEIFGELGVPEAEEVDARLAAG